MASIFRSAKMSLCQLFLSNEVAYNCVSELGELGLVQFRDLNENVNSFQRKYVNEVRRCEEMERKLRFIENESTKENISIYDNGENPEAPQPREIIDFEATFEQLEIELKEVNANAETLTKNYTELTELKYVLTISSSFFDHGDIEYNQTQSNLMPLEEGQGMNLGFMAGVIHRKKMATFERLLWRVCRGNVYVRQQEIEDQLPLTPSTVDKTNKIVFVVFFQGDRLKGKVRKVCEGCQATVYPCPESATERATMLQGVQTRLKDLNVVLSQTTEHRHRVLVEASKNLRIWLTKARKIKAVYHSMNSFSFDVTNKCLIAEAWIPENQIDRIRRALQIGTEKSGSSMQPILHTIDTNMHPPTYHPKSKFTAGFQALIDAYGICTYREVNPGLYTTITFPFLFAVMFGDCGHGLILFLFGLYMVLNEVKIKAQKSKNEIWRMMFGGRYIILLMGSFSLYTGFIYNDIFSKSLNIFGSRFHIGNRSQDSILVQNMTEYTLDPGYKQDYEGYPYPVGLDPVWQLSTNKINFYNSFKMKISIIIGVCHMMFGVCLSLVNHIYFKRTINIIFEFLPQVLFLMGLFGYLCFMVIYKWMFYGAGQTDFGFDPQHDSYCAPSVLILFIDMALFKTEDTLPGCDSPFLFQGQFQVQAILVIVAVISVPVMLFPKPFILKRQHENKMRRKNLTGVDNPLIVSVHDNEIDQENGTVIHRVSSISSHDSGVAVSHIETDEEEFEFGEVFIHQAIHTIEYVLGCVSHTASYLRLWALSLAHAQLSEVLWMMVFRIGLAQSSTGVGSVMLFVIFAAWSFLTISILVLMEGLSAFLHTLRLHWVEFCSKFLDGQGYMFRPFAFKHFVNVEEE